MKKDDSENRPMGNLSGFLLLGFGCIISALFITMIFEKVKQLPFFNDVEIISASKLLIHKMR